VSHFFTNAHLDGMRTTQPLAFLALASLTIVACDAKDTLLHARDGAAALGAGGAGSGGSGGHLGTGGGGGSGLGGSGGTTVTGTGGGVSVGGSGGAGLGGSGRGGAAGNPGTGGATKDGGLPDAASDVAMVADAPVSDDGVSCGLGYPVGSQRPMGDGCNTCYCESNGVFLCTTKACSVPDASADISADAGQCPAGQIYCPGCTPGTGTCGTVCTGAPCPCTGSACPMVDASTTKDALLAEAGSATCSQLTTQAECDGRGDCHSLYRSIGACGCGGSPGCCMHFLSCADGATAKCTPPASIGCTIATPACDSPFVLSYTPGCYEGCVKASECAP